MKNIHKAKFILIGVIIGLMASSLSVYADEITEYVLTKINYTILVNNEEYQNDELPILNYQGQTYIPLRSIGLLLDAKVDWNSELRQVELINNSIYHKGDYNIPTDEDENTN